MKPIYLLALMSLVVCFVLPMQTGCQSQTEPEGGSKPALAAPVEPVTKEAPKITFERVTYNLGDVGPGSKHPCEFKFTNTGGDVLKIKPVQSSCSCTLASLTKKEYAPGESGAIEVKSFHAPEREGPIKQHLYVYSNDEVNPKVTLTVEANVVMKVDCNPKMLNLLLKSENAGCPQITLSSIDNQPFAIKQFNSTANCITADVNSSVKSTKFVLQPKVDMEILQKVPHGRISISLTHPECKTVVINFDALPRFKAEPQAVMIYKAEPQKPILKELWVLNNYNEEFEVESVSSKKGTIKVSSQQKIGNRYKFQLQITPPEPTDKRKMFTDIFIVKIKNGEELKINCYMAYPNK
jgi:hypothetical protein